VKNVREIKQFGERLRTLRREAKMSQEQLSWDAEIGLRSVQRLESGQNAASIDLIFSISKALNINPDELFKGIETEP